MQKYRTASESCIYHVTARGVGGQVIFEDDSDRRFFGEKMRTYMGKHGVELLAWCFMQNHVHLLPRCSMEALSRFMGQLLGDYAAHFNRKYERVGHLFQGRFDSVAVQSEEQLLCTVRYIHQNPMRAGLALPADWRWSSYREYLGEPFITDTPPVLETLGGREGFERFHAVEGTEASIERWEPRKPLRLSDDEAIALAKEVSGCARLSDIAASDKEARDAMLALLKSRGLSISQLARLTGISRSVVQRAGGPSGPPALSS